MLRMWTFGTCRYERLTHLLSLEHCIKRQESIVLIDRGPQRYRSSPQHKGITHSLLDSMRLLHILPQNLWHRIVTPSRSFYTFST